MAVMINLWVLFTGAVCGVAAVFGARGRNKYLRGALIGAGAALVMSIIGANM